MLARPRPDWLRLGWLVAATAESLALLRWIGWDGLVNHGDTGFPLNAVQRFIDGLWAWSPRLNFGVPQYLAHTTLPFDALRTLPQLLGLSVLHQSQLYFVATFILVAAAAERFATVGLALRQPVARLLVAALLTVNPFNVGQLVGGQGLQLIQCAAILAAVTAFLQVTRGERRQLAWYAFWSLFVGSVFFPLLAITIFTVILAQPRTRWRRLTVASLGAIAVNLFWIIPIVARALAAPITAEIFQAGTGASVLDATQAFTGLGWVVRLAYGNYPVSTPFVTFVASAAGLVSGFGLTMLALLAFGGRRYSPSNRRLLAAFGGLWITSLLLATGIHYAWFAPLYRWLFTHVPLFQAYRVPAKWLILVMLSEGAVLGLGFEAWSASRRPGQRRAAWAGGLLALAAIGALGGLPFGRSIAHEIALAHYPADYFAVQEPAGRWLELLPQSTEGGYEPTQDLPTSVVRAYAPGAAPSGAFDTSVGQAVAHGTIDPFLASRGLSGWLLHGDIPMADSLSRTIGPAVKPLEFRPANQAPAAPVSVFEHPALTNVGLPNNRPLSVDPASPYLTVTNPPPADEAGRTIWQLRADTGALDVQAAPLDLGRPGLGGPFRVTGLVDGSSAPVVLVNDSRVGTTVDPTTHQFRSDPIRLKPTDQLALTAAADAPPLANLTFQTERFAVEGPVSLDHPETGDLSLSCQRGSVGAVTTVTGIDPSQPVTLTYQATTAGGAPSHAALEWLTATGTSLGVTTLPSGTVVAPASSTARLSFYCEAAPGHTGVVSYRSIRFGPETGPAVRDAYLVSDAPAPASEATATFKQSSRVSYTVTSAPTSGLLVLRQHDDPWWQAIDANGHRLPKVGQAYGLFPAWQLNGSTTVRIVFTGQAFFDWGVALSLLAWVGLLTMLYRSDHHAHR